jgi:hypothetical protein
MPIENGDFAVEGASPGVPRAWRVRSLVQAERLAGFGAIAPYEGVETFEGWSQLLLRLGLVEQAFFDARPEALEDFTEGWDVDFYALAFDDVGVETATFGGGLTERFVAGWEVEAFIWAFSDDALLAAQFAGAAVEAFESGHRNDSYRFQHGPGALLWASLSGAAVETFENTWPAHDTRGGGHHGE